MRHLVLACVLVSIAGCGDGGRGSGDAGGPRIDSGGDVDAGGGGDAGGAPDGSAGDDGGGATIDAGGAADAQIDGGPPVSMPCTPTGMCDPFAASPCPAGESCRIGGMGLRCYPHDAPPRAEGTVCTAPAQCAPGMMCLSFGVDPTSYCTRLCPDGSIGYCGADAACTGTLGDACVQACRPLPERCDVYAQDCADPIDTCTLTSNPETRENYTGCRPAGPRAEGETCGSADGTCGHDLICIRVAGVTACRQPCDPEDASETCPSGQACTGMARTWMVGFCQPPP